MIPNIVSIRRLSFAALWSILTLAGFSGGLQAQDVSIQLFQPPPNQLKVADFWRITLINNTDESVRVYLRGTAEAGQDGIVAEARSSTFDLPPGPGIVRITARDIEPISEIRSNPRYKGILERTGNVPSGEYIVCAYVHLASTGEELGRDCIEQIVEILSPPVLVAPDDGETVAEKLPLFSWLPPVPLQPGQRVEYILTIAQILGRQSPYDALQSNPAWFIKTDIRPTILQYPVSARSFQNGRYAWKIEAFVDGFKMGESEIWVFEYKPALQVMRADLDKLNKLAIQAKGAIPAKLLNELLRSCHGN